MGSYSWSLNPEAPAFFPPSKNALPIFPTIINPPWFLQSLDAFSADPHKPFFHYPFPSRPLEPQYFLVEAVAAPLPENIEHHHHELLPVSSSSLLETFKSTKMVAPKENAGVVRSVRRSNCKDKRRHRKQGLLPKKTPESVVANETGGGVKRPSIPLKSDGKETTVMIRNVPNRFTREMLKGFLDKHCLLANRESDSSFSAFDFLYLPIDFLTGSNKGYAFVNFTEPEAARKFFDAWDAKRWDCFKSYKICEVCCAKLQGMEKLLKHFETMEFPNEKFQPLSFLPARDGSREPVKETVVGKCNRSSLYFLSDQL